MSDKEYDFWLTEDMIRWPGVMCWAECRMIEIKKAEYQ